jgi:hypothetical protein
LARVIQHVLLGQSGIYGIDFANSEQGLMEQAERLRPGLIIVNSRLLGPDAGTALTRLKRANPLSKLILTCNFEEFESIDPGIVDVRILEETIVQQLPGIARRLTNRPRARSSVVQQLILVVALFLLSFAGSAFAQQTDSATHAPLNYYTLAPPAAGSSYVDPVFGSTIKRMSNSLVEPNVANGSGTLPFISDEYSSMSPFNSDNSRILGLHFSYFGLYDSSGSLMKNLNVCASCEPRWSKTNPSVLYFISGNQLKRLDVSTDAVSVVHTFSEYASISGKGESDISADGDHFVFAGNNSSVFVYEISTDTKGPVFDTAGHGFDSLYVTPNNNVTITWFQNGTARYNGIEFFDGNMNFLRQVAPAGGHMDVTSDTNGDEILLWTNSADPTPICSNAIVKIRLSDAHETCLISLDWSLALHVSATDTGGWFFMETYAPIDPGPDSAAWKPYTNEILQVKLDGTEVRRLAHHRSRPFDGYNYTPRASASRDGSRLIFTSNFGLYGPSTLYTDVYLMVLSPTPAPVPVPPPADTAAPTAPSNLTSTAASSTQINLSWTASTDNIAVTQYFLERCQGLSCTVFAQIASPTVTNYSDAGLTAGNSYSYQVRAADAANYLSGYSNTASATTPAPASAPTPAPAPIRTLQVQTSIPGSARVVRNEQTNSAIAYSGTWSTNNLSSHSGSSATMTMDSGSRATFTFAGTGISWIGYRDEWSGMARVYLDDTLTATVDTFASPATARTVLYSVAGLPSGIHTLVLEATGARNSKSGGSWVWVDALDVNSSSTSDSVDISKVQVGYGVMDTGMGAAVLRSFSGQDLVSEAAIPASAAANNWIMYAEKGADVSTGVAIANPNNIDVNVNLVLSDGRQTSLRIPAMGQHAAFVDELFGNFQGSFLGTLKIQSNTPVAVLALRGTTNAKGQFIIASIPLNSSATEFGGTKVFPSIADGGGYNSELILVNPASTVSTGSIQFSFDVSTDLGANSTFNFSIPAGGVWRIRTMSGANASPTGRSDQEMSGANATVTSGYASLIMSYGSPMPDATAIVRLSSNGDLVSETAVPAQNRITRSLMFGSFEPNRHTGVAIVNPSSQDIQVTLTPFDGNGGSVAPARTLTLRALSQTSAFLDELIGGLPSGFKGSVLLEAASPVYAISIRGTTNSQGGFLMSTLSMFDLKQVPSGTRYFPHVITGGLYKTEFLIMYTGTSAPPLSLFGTDGKPMAMPLQ